MTERAVLARRFMLGMSTGDELIWATGKSTSLSIMDRQNSLKEACPACERGEGGGVGDGDGDRSDGEDIAILLSKSQGCYVQRRPHGES